MKISDQSVYAEKLLVDLEAGTQLRQMIWEEGQHWSTAMKWLKDAADGEIVPIIFRDADKGGDITHFAVLKRVDLLPDGRTHYTIEKLRRLAAPVPFHELVLLNAGRPIKEDDIRSYRLIRTPEAVSKVLASY